MKAETRCAYRRTSSGILPDIAHVRGDLRTWATDFDDPADATGRKYYIVPVDGADKLLHKQDLRDGNLGI